MVPRSRKSHLLLRSESGVVSVGGLSSPWAGRSGRRSWAQGPAWCSWSPSGGPPSAAAGPARRSPASGTPRRSPRTLTPNHKHPGMKHFPTVTNHGSLDQPHPEMTFLCHQIMQKWHYPDRKIMQKNNAEISMRHTPLSIERLNERWMNEQ